MITVENLSFTYPNATEPAIKGLSFGIVRGEIFGFLGPSGAGKSTTQKILIGLLKDYQGQVSVLGKDLKDWRADYYERIGVSFEAPNHYLKLTALENLRYFAALYGNATQEPGGLLDRVGLGADGDKPVSQFSKGMKNRLNVARALLHDPELLFLDEPTTGLDPVNALLVRFFLPVISGRLENTLHFSFGDFYQAIASYALLITAPVMCGMVIGFLLLDEHDDRILLALRVTPLPPGAYMAWRLSLPMLLSVAVTLAAFLLAGLSQPGVPGLLSCALATAPVAPLVALALAVFAQNKVQGFALVKASSVFQMAPLVAYFVRAEWQPAFWIFPTYWPAKLLWTLQTGGGNAWRYLAAGLAYQLLLLFILLRRFNRLAA